ncbi:MAG TPA: ATP-binding protein, partial [Myxococcota bacterium]|nr:ATP-binding protein [Myxococcota bacterium]
HVHWVELWVQDHGSGFPAEEAELLFEPYQRGQSGQPRHGTGLGLYLARSLARSMGGELRATSPGIGKGATFHLRLLRER